MNKVTLVLLLSFFFVISSFSQSGTCGVNLTWILDNNTLTISGTGKMSNYYSTSTPSPWYSKRSLIKYVVINEGVTHIGDYAFYKCSNILTTTIPISLNSIGNNGFQDCSSLTSMNFSSGITTIGSNAFQNTGLTEVSLSDNVVSVGENAFLYTPWYNEKADGVVYAGKTLLKYKGLMPANTIIAVNEGTTLIASYAFERFTNLTSVTFPNTLKYIGRNAFLGCSISNSLLIPDGVKLIDAYAFKSCANLSSVNIGNGLISIGNYAFESCTKLTNVNLGSAVTDIGNGAFLTCSNLTTINIPDGLKQIGSSAFDGCKISALSIPNSVISIGAGAFNGTTFLQNLQGPIVYVGKILLINKSSLATNLNVKVVEGTLGIAGGAFFNNAGLVSIDLPNSLLTIGEGAFSGCTNLVSISIPNSVFSNVKEETFLGCSNLAIVNMSNQIPNIEKKAFRGCVKLKSISISDNISTIGEEAFFLCTALDSVVIGKNVTDIGANAFAGCSAVAKFYSLNPNPATCYYHSFYGSYLNSGNLYVPAGSKTLYQEAYVWKDFANIIEMTTNNNQLTEGVNPNIYPNPAKDFISLNSNPDIINITINDIDGIVVFNQSENLEKSISISFLPKGIYFVSITTNNGITITKKLIKN